MKTEPSILASWSTRRIKKRMLQDLYAENLSIRGGAARRRRAPGGPLLLVKGLVLFAALFSFTLTRNSVDSSGSTLPALPLSHYLAQDGHRQPLAPFRFYQQKAAAIDDFQPLLRQKDLTLRSLFGLQVRTIVIDPGHGGDDPGTSGASGTHEKDITLDIAQRLSRRLGRFPGLRTRLTRDADDTLSLAARIDFANAQQADLFLSIHVNYIPDKPYSIIETYYFGPSSDRGVVSLAARENRDAESTVSDFRAMLQKIGNTLKTQEARALAVAIQRSLFDSLHREKDNLYDYGVKRAPFIVLLGVDMPSVLSEVTCLSDPGEERKLQGEAYREELAGYLEAGILEYLRMQANPTASEV